MRLIGLTGGIGSGKSSVSRILAELGAYVVDADQIAHQLQARGRPVWRAIWEQFGWPVLTADGSVDRKKLGYHIFSDGKARESLNRIVHPPVQSEIKRLVKDAESQGGSLAVLDVPLLIEGGLYRVVDTIWVVYTEPRQQIERICLRDGVSRETAERRLQAQMPLKDKVALADVVIDNRGDLATLEEEVRGLWQRVAADG